MKNIILIISLFCFTVPVFAVCSITGGACSANYTPNWESPPLDEKYDPDYLEDLQKTDAFQPKYIKPYYDELINTESAQGESDFNSNCQFGVCMPGQTTGAGAEITE